MNSLWTVSNASAKVRVLHVGRGADEQFVDFLQRRATLHTSRTSAAWRLQFRERVGRTISLRARPVARNTPLNCDCHRSEGNLVISL